MLKIDVHTKGIFLAGFLTWCLTFGGAWITYTNTITQLKTNQVSMLKTIDKMQTTIEDQSNRIAETEQSAAVTTNVVIRLNQTLDKIDGTLDKIATDVTKNTIRLDGLSPENKGDD